MAFGVEDPADEIMSYTAAAGVAAGVTAGAAGNRIWRNAGLRAGARCERQREADARNDGEVISF